jgi:hypothetical protein
VAKSYPVRVKKHVRQMRGHATTFRRVSLVVDLSPNDWRLLLAYWSELDIRPGDSCEHEHSAAFVDGLKRQLGWSLVRGTNHRKLLTRSLGEADAQEEKG